jgi:tRNA (guanine37-N1)-methyltransferase
LQVSNFVRPFNRDGRNFIWQAADLVCDAAAQGEQVILQPKRPKGEKTRMPGPEPIIVPVPATISHFVMNLPGSAITFVHHYRGLYSGREMLFSPHTDIPLPLVHVHCFSFKAEKGQAAAAVDNDICQRLSDELDFLMKPGDAEKKGEVAVYEVRNVAPNKTMYCASFRIPPEVAFAPRSEATT